MNLVALIGNIATEPELRHTEGGMSVCTFGIDVVSNGEPERFSVITFDRQADIVAEYLSLGRRVSIEGRLRSINSTVQIIAKRVGLLSKPI